MDSLRRGCHHIGQAGGLRVAALCDDAKYSVAFCKNPNQILVFDNHDSADFPTRKHLGSFPDSGFRWSSEKLFLLHDSSNRFTKHLWLPILCPIASAAARLTSCPALARLDFAPP